MVFKNYLIEEVKRVDGSRDEGILRKEIIRLSHER